MPGVRRQGEELRRRQGQRHEGREEGRCRSATPPSRWWPTPSGRPRPRSTRCRSSGTKARTPRSPAPAIADMLKAGLDAEQAFVGNQNGDAKAALAGAAKKVEAVYSYPVPEPRLHGADERHRALHARQVRGVGADAGRRRLVRGGARRLRPAGRQVRGLQDQPRRRLRPARRVPGLCASGGQHRQGDARHADQAALDRAKRTWCRAGTTRSCSASSSARSTRTTT